MDRNPSNCSVNYHQPEMDRYVDPTDMSHSSTLLPASSLCEPSNESSYNTYGRSHAHSGRRGWKNHSGRFHSQEFNQRQRPKSSQYFNRYTYDEQSAEFYGEVPAASESQLLKTQEYGKGCRRQVDIPENEYDNLTEAGNKSFRGRKNYKSKNFSRQKVEENGKSNNSDHDKGDRSETSSGHDIHDGSHAQNDRNDCKKKQLEMSEEIGLSSYRDRNFELKETTLKRGGYENYDSRQHRERKHHNRTFESNFKGLEAEQNKRTDEFVNDSGAISKNVNVNEVNEDFQLLHMDETKFSDYHFVDKPSFGSVEFSHTLEGKGIGARQKYADKSSAKIHKWETHASEKSAEMSNTGSDRRRRNGKGDSSHGYRDYVETGKDMDAFEGRKGEKWMENQKKYGSHSKNNGQSKKQLSNKENRIQETENGTNRKLDNEKGKWNNDGLNSDKIVGKGSESEKWAHSRYLDKSEVAWNRLNEKGHTEVRIGNQQIGYKGHFESKRDHKKKHGFSNDWHSKNNDLKSSSENTETCVNDGDFDAKGLAAVREQPKEAMLMQKEIHKKNKEVKLSKKSATEFKKGYWQDETQRGLLIEQLFGNEYECLVCCNIIKNDAAVWSCSHCYHIYHLYCIKKWAHSSAAVAPESGAAGGWRCPTCQNTYFQVPNQYTCFCGKQKDPAFTRFSTPHSCGDLCAGTRGPGCTHPCNILCHPGPCPPCSAFIVRSCECGKIKQSIKCATSVTVRCTDKCGRILNCGQHECSMICHGGSCNPCNMLLTRTCHCGKESREFVCGSAESFLLSFSCGAICDRMRSCGHHKCNAVCHPGPCADCALLPTTVTHCPCGKTPLLEIPRYQPRKSCDDPVATCDKICGNELPCGNEDARHHCRQKCHNGHCPSECDGTTSVTCRCGAFTKELPCAELKQFETVPFMCDRRCKKKLSCGRHRCSQLCCISKEHQCQLTCGYKLSCGLHKCEEPCHKGNCPTCWQVSFDELRCYCGAEIMYPPVPCGTKPPECNRPCTRQQSCNHKATHRCHSEETCPPCIVLTEKWCLGNHELRHNIPCYVTEISCGMQCLKELSCLVHKCQKVCHKGPCLDGQVCTQPCPMIRDECGHPCNAPCHPGLSCPATQCKAEVNLQCECGRRKEKGQCLKGHDPSALTDYSKMTAQYVATKLWEGQSIDLSVMKEGSKKIRKLACTSECSIMERNQRLALALEIKNPDLSSKLGNPTYSQFLKDYARQNPKFVAGIEKELADLVTASQKAKTGKKSHAFKSMPSNQRHLIHELAEFYGCQTESYDEEPNKNVVATAMKDKCWLPSLTLTALIQRELFPKAPLPIPINCKEEQLRSVAQAAKRSTEVFTVSGTGTSKSTSLQGIGASNRKTKESVIDYFDLTD